jgi:hypothetical protein
MWPDVVPDIRYIEPIGAIALLVDREASCGSDGSRSCPHPPFISW